jgi:hypothetical protein
MASTQGIRAGRAFVELFADSRQLVRGLRRAEKRLKAFGDSIRNFGLELAGLGSAMLAPRAAWDGYIACGVDLPELLTDRGEARA